MRYGTSIVWLRRDLRLRDNVALARACEHSRRVCIAFVVNPPLLNEDRMGAPLVSVFFGALAQLRSELRRADSELALLTGDFEAELLALSRRIGAEAIFFNEDYEPAAVRRDAAATRAFAAGGLAVEAALDHVYFGADEITRDSGEPYQVYTPYKRRWLDRRALAPRAPVPSHRLVRGKLISPAQLGATQPVPRCEDFGFRSDARYPNASEALAAELLRSFLAPDGAGQRYRELRNYPGVTGTSLLSPQLRAGTIGIRTCVETAFARCAGAAPDARANIEAWIGELVWRDFYQMVLKRFPDVERASFQPRARRIPWLNPQPHFDLWCRGATGYPIVDAAMRQLNETGWMHNRLRMIAASFLSKHLLIDWRLGERYFERRLADADLAQNNGGWQWAASTGTDAVPYFRIFNPTVQSKRFDPEGAFIRRMLPVLRDVPGAFIHEPWRMPPIVAASSNVVLGHDYPLPIVELSTARARAIAAFEGFS